MSDYGMKVSRPGYDIATASDRQLLFSSAFATLVTVASYTISGGASVAHGLGYAPVSWCIAPPGTVAGTTLNGFDDADISADTSNIYNLDSASVIAYVFARDIRTSYTAPNIITTDASQGTVSQDYGFKVSKAGYDATTTGLTNLVTFSGQALSGNAVRQVIIHQSDFHDNIADSQTVTYSHNLGYVPLFLAWRRNYGNLAYIFTCYKASASYNGADLFRVSVDSSKISFTLNGVGAQDIAYVIFKDPF